MTEKSALSRYRHKSGMKYGYARVSTDGQSMAAQTTKLSKNFVVGGRSGSLMPLVQLC